MDTPILSIYIPTYNHENYIVRALDSVLMQKTQYTYEVLVGEDASTDGTRAVLKEYEAKHPGKLTVFYRETNMHNSPLPNAADLKQRCRGKYMIALEGDDFWIDDQKLEKQITFLETHPDYLAVAHNCVVVGEDSEPNGEHYPECKDEEYTLRHYVSGILPGQLTTVMYRNYMKQEYMDTSVFDLKLNPGDRLLYFALTAHGKVFCLQETMSAYRHVTTHGSSYSATTQYTFKTDEKWSAGLMHYSFGLRNPQAKKYAQLIYFRSLVQGLRTNQLSWRGFTEKFSQIQAKTATIWLYIRSFIAQHILKRKFWA
ncbi:MAG: glycosyltransferase family 2 protein [Clostridia bacterium]|nr:glycosyltransferase family 2 protein [Clostridia bacterium]